jgi:ParB-like chromosome segregation protein Spo0J
VNEDLKEVELSKIRSNLCKSDPKLEDIVKSIQETGRKTHTMNSRLAQGYCRQQRKQA